MTDGVATNGRQHETGTPVCVCVEEAKTNKMIINGWMRSLERPQLSDCGVCFDMQHLTLISWLPYKNMKEQLQMYPNN
jgi:hypothetical protein